MSEKQFNEVIVGFGGMGNWHRELIESEALRMISAFKGKGSLIINDYASYPDIGVEEECATWARDVFMAHLADK